MRALTPLLLVLVACEGGVDPNDDTDAIADTDPTTPEAWLDVFASDGAGHVGYTESEVVYDDAATNAPRTLRLGIWYPTDVAVGSPATFTGPRAPTDAWLDAPPSAGRFPLAIFAHGHQGDLDNAASLMAWFARHGWIAAAPEFTGNTLADGPDRTAAIYVQRPHDVSATLDLLLDGSADWSARTDPDRVFVFGHSFGGYTMFPLAGATWRADEIVARCESTGHGSECVGLDDDIEAMLHAGAVDPRPLAFGVLSGGNDDLVDDATVDRPMLLMIGDTEGTGPTDAHYAMLPHAVRVDIVHGDHQTYTDFAQVGGGVIPGTSPDAIAWDRGWRIVRSYLGAHAWKHVLGKQGLDGILDGSVVVDADEVKLETK